MAWLESLRELGCGNACPAYHALPSVSVAARPQSRSARCLTPDAVGYGKNRTGRSTHRRSWAFVPNAPSNAIDD